MTRNSSDSGDEWLSRLILQSLHDLLQTVGAVKSAQEQMPRDLMRHIDRQADHFNERIADLTMNYGLRLSALEEQAVERAAKPAPSPQEPASSTVRLFGSVGAWLIEIIPWKHVAYMAPGVVVAIAGHMFPAEVAAALKALPALFGNRQP